MDDLKTMRNTTAKMASVPLVVVFLTDVLKEAVSFLLSMGFLPGVASTPDALLLAANLSRVAAYLFAVLYVRYLMGQNVKRINFVPVKGINPVPIILASVGLIVAAARLTTVVNDAFFGAFSVESGGDIFREYNIFVLLITSVILPAFFEELVFRGLILTNLLPYGRTFAIVVSGIIFGVAHGSLSQILFAVLAGILLGWVYVETGSLWCGIFIHFVNNLISICEGAMISALPYDIAMKYVYIIEITVLLVGIISVAAMFGAIGKRKEEARRNGFFGVTPVTFRPAAKKVEIGDGLIAFFNPVMIIFLLYSFLPVFI